MRTIFPASTINSLAIAICGFTMIITATITTTALSSVLACSILKSTTIIYTLFHSTRTLRMRKSSITFIKITTKVVRFGTVSWFVLCFNRAIICTVYSKSCSLWHIWWLANGRHGEPSIIDSFSLSTIQWKSISIISIIQLLGFLYLICKPGN